MIFIYKKKYVVILKFGMDILGYSILFLYKYYIRKYEFVRVLNEKIKVLL